MLQNTLLCGKRHNIHTKVLNSAISLVRNTRAISRKQKKCFVRVHIVIDVQRLFCNVIIFIAQFPKNASSQAGHHVQDQIWTFAAVIIYDGVLFYWKMCYFSCISLALWISNWFPFLFSCSFVLRSIGRSIFHATCELDLQKRPLAP